MELDDGSTGSKSPRALLPTDCHAPTSTPPRLGACRLLGALLGIPPNFTDGEWTPASQGQPGRERKSLPPRHLFKRCVCIWSPAAREPFIGTPEPHSAVGTSAHLTPHPHLTHREPTDPLLKVTRCWGPTEPGGSLAWGWPTLQGASPAYLPHPGAVAPPGKQPPGCCSLEHAGHSWAAVKGQWALKLHELIGCAQGGACLRWHSLRWPCQTLLSPLCLPGPVLPQEGEACLRQKEAE